METALDVERLRPLIEDRFPGAYPRIERIPAGLGDRRFYRVSLDSSDAPGSAYPATLIARIEPDPSDPDPRLAAFAWLPEPPLEPIRSILEEAGLPVPRSYASHPGHGIDLLEDAGTRTLADTTGDEQRRRYLEASDLIPRIQAIRASPGTAPAFDRVMGADLIRTKAAKVVHWSFPGLLGRPASEAECRSIENGFDAIAALLDEAPRRLSHRDYKAENLLLAPPVDATDTGSERLLMIDVQGAFMAPPEYDLVCLLRDLQVDLPEPLVAEAREIELSRLPDAASRAESQRRFEAIAVVRLAKDIAHIVHAGRMRGDRRRWHEIPRGLTLLEESLGRLEHTFAPAEKLHYVIHALTQSAQTSDIEAYEVGDLTLLPDRAPTR
jgi:aminoglycoside/choline kinase family phosphotransferase